MISFASRRTLAAYAACLTVMAGLLYVVALGGNAVTPKRTIVDLSLAEIAKQQR